MLVPMVLCSIITSPGTKLNTHIFAMHASARCGGMRASSPFPSGLLLAAAASALSPTAPAMDDPWDPFSGSMACAVSRPVYGRPPGLSRLPPTHAPATAVGLVFQHRMRIQETLNGRKRSKVHSANAFSPRNRNRSAAGTAFLAFLGINGPLRFSAERPKRPKCVHRTRSAFFESFPAWFWRCSKKGATKPVTSPLNAREYPAPCLLQIADGHDKRKEFIFVYSFSFTWTF